MARWRRQNPPTLVGKRLLEMAEQYRDDPTRYVDIVARK
jgi:hypothetical protein